MRTALDLLFYKETVRTSQQLFLQRTAKIQNSYEQTLRKRKFPIPRNLLTVIKTPLCSVQ